MANLTKEHFDKQLKKLVGKQDLNNQLKVQTKELKDYTGKQIEILAHLVARGFTTEHHYLEKRFNEVTRMLDVRKEVDELKTKMHRVFQTLNI